jgi:gliding motility-associated-like protein
LQYRTKSGCEGTAYYFKIVIYNKPVADFVVRGSGDICGNTPVYFNSKVSGNNEHYYWDMGDGTATTGYAPQHQYRQAGSYTVMLITVNGLCRDTMVKKDIVRVIQPFPKIKTVTNTCEGDRTEVMFADASTGADSLTWVWGDGQQQSVDTATTGLSHRYSGTGSYKVVLIAHKDQCHTRDSVIVHVLKKQSPSFITDKQIICKDDHINYTIDNLQYNPGFNYYYISPYWPANFLYKDNSVFTGQRGYNGVNNYIINGWLGNIQPDKDSLAVIVKSAYFGCFDTSNYVPVAIQTPSAGFKVLKEPQCLNSPAIFLDTSHASGNSRLVGHTWQMGDGQSIYVENKDTVIYSYSHPGYYHVTLSVTDDKGCSASSSTAGTTVLVKGPEAKFSPSGDHLPRGSTIEFYNRSITIGSSQVEYHWDFGDGQKAVGFNASHQYPLPGNYDVQLVAKDPGTGCTSAYHYTIHIEPFNAGFRYSGTTLASHDCYPLQIQFTNTSFNYSKLKWDFGDGTLLYNVSNPSHIYKEAGTYIVKLEVVNYYGEVKNYYDTLHLQPPIASVQVTPSNACLGDPVTLKFSGSSDLKYSWDLGDGHILKGSDSLSKYVFSRAGEFKPGIIISNGDGCITAFSLQDAIKIHDKPVLAANPSQPIICRGASQIIQLSGAVRYEWSPADGVSDAHAAAPVINPQQSTTYQIKFWDAWACSNYDSLWVEVIAPPSLWIAEDTAICRGDSFMIRAGGADIYSWIDETAGLSAVHINNPNAKPDQSILYTLQGTDRMGCFADTANIRVTVMDLPTVELSPELDVMPGQSLPLEPQLSSDVQVITWTPATYLSCSDCISPVCRPENDMEYLVNVSNSNHCTATAKLKVKLICDETRVAIPNAFTPNADGKNDLFVIKGISRIRHLLIYNRWGQKIFERKDFAASDPAGCWNGTIGGYPAETGTYVYYVEMECPEGGMFYRKGTVTLIR